MKNDNKCKKLIRSSLKSLNQSSLRVCHVVASVNENTGGPAYSVTHLAAALASCNTSSHLFTLNYKQHGQQVPAQNVKVHSYPATWTANYIRGFQPTAQIRLQQLAANELDLIHNHGLWMFPNLYARQAAIKNQLPLLISPRGMLENWSLKNSWYKKLPAWLLYEQKNLKCASAFHATSEVEAQSIRQLGFRQPIALLPNGVSMPKLEDCPNRDILVGKFPELRDKHWMLFLSRIHPKKGLDNLLQAWKPVATQFSDWHLIVAGPDLIGYQASLKRLSAELELERSVTFTGMLSGEIKASALSNANLFVLPTYSENFGIAIAESLAYGIPVITTKNAPWQDIETYQCGWWIENKQETLEKTLIEAIDLPASERQIMGSRGRQLIEQKYSWNSIAQEMAVVYQWVLRGGQTPSCVQLH